MTKSLRPAIRINKLKSILDIICNVNETSTSKTSLCLWGKHGFGKTQSIKDYAKENNMKFVSVNTAQFEEMGDFLGMPMIENDKTSYIIPEWVPTEEGPGILLLDDFNRTHNRILNGLMQLIQDHEVVSWKLPKGWTIVLTANPADNGDDLYTVGELDPAQATRMLHFDIQFDFNGFIEYLVSKDHSQLLVSFFADDIGKNLLLDQEKSDGKLVPRTIEMFLNSVKNIDINVSNDEHDSVGTIGLMCHAAINHATSIALTSYLLNKPIVIPSVLEFMKIAKPEKLWAEINTYVKFTDENGVKIRQDIASVMFSRFFFELSTIYRANKEFDNKLITMDEYSKIIKSNIMVSNKDIIEFIKKLFPLEKEVQDLNHVKTNVAIWAERILTSSTVAKPSDYYFDLANYIRITVKDFLTRTTSLTKDKSSIKKISTDLMFNS